MQLDVESLRAFATVLDAGGMTRAAERLDMSQSAVSWKIKRLEERVGRDLLIRDGRTLRPSRDGEELLRYARSLIETHDEAVARLTGSDLTGRIRLGATEEVGAHHLGPVVGRFNRIHPALTIEIRIDTSNSLLADVGEGRLDLVLVQIDAGDRQPDDTVLWLDELGWISSPEWTYLEGPVPVVSFGDDCFYRPRASRALAEAGVPHSFPFSGASTASVIAGVEAGFGVAVMSRRSIGGDVIEWPRAAQLPPLPPVYQVVRLAPGPVAPEVAQLVADLERVLVEGSFDAAVDREVRR
jgi:DNA-binding transcriptional LysR family regulator